MKLKNVSPMIAVALAALLVASCNLVSNSNNAPLTLKGTVEAEEHYIRCKVDSRVKTVFVKEGDSVVQGQPLISLDASEIKTDLSRADRKLKEANQAVSEASKNFEHVKAEIEKQKKKSKGFFSKLFSTKKGRSRKEREFRKMYKDAKTELVIARKQKEYIEQKRKEGSKALDLFTLTSPVAGTVSIVSVKRGEEAGPGQILLTVAEKDSKFFRTRVKRDEREAILGSVSGELFLEESPTKGLKVALKTVADKPAFTPESDRAASGKKEFRVELEIEEENVGLKPGMRGMIVIKKNPKGL